MARHRNGKITEHVLQEALLWLHPKRHDKAASEVRRGHGQIVRRLLDAAYHNQNFIRVHLRFAGRMR
jgi:hypothetical protein